MCPDIICEKLRFLIKSWNRAGTIFAKFYGNFKYHNIDFYVFQNVSNNYGYTTNLFGKKNFPKELLFFLKENKINDIHSGNYVIINNLPVIFDYAEYDGGL